MITSPIVATSTLLGGTTATFQLFDFSAQKTDRRTTDEVAEGLGLRTTIAHAQTGENKAYGGSTRSVVRVDLDAPQGADGLGPCGAYAQFIVSRPVNPAAIDRATVKDLIQLLVNILLAENDGTQSADSTLDSAFAASFLAGEP